MTCSSTDDDSSARVPVAAVQSVFTTAETLLLLTVSCVLLCTHVNSSFVHSSQW
jgi:hypothetical protein